MVEVSRETVIAQFFSTDNSVVDRYAQILVTWGIDRGLVGPGEGERIWDRHIANCLPVTTLIPAGATVLDVGSGAGLPGIIIALARPDLTVTLLEPLERRANFLIEVVSELNLPITVIRARSEAVKGSYGVVTARAVAPLTKLIPMVWHLVAIEGSLLAMKGENAEKEILNTKFRKGIEARTHKISLPDLPLSRVIEVRRSG
jgi:16S rRNA (guanine527-N7)-methyltransferase